VCWRTHGLLNEHGAGDGWRGACHLSRRLAIPDSVERHCLAGIGLSVGAFDVLTSTERHDVADAAWMADQGGCGRDRLATAAVGCSEKRAISKRNPERAVGNGISLQERRSDR